MARCDFKFCPDCGVQLDIPSPSDATACSLSLILARELNRYQPHTNCRRTIDRVIDAAISDGLIHDLTPLAAVEPAYIRKANETSPSVDAKEKPLP